MLKLVLLLVTLAMLSALQERLHLGLRDREQAARAMAVQLQTVAEAAQRYAVDTNALRPGATTASLTVEELILASYLPEGSSLFGPFGGPIRLTARTGAHGHVTVDVEVDLPEESSVDLRKAMADLDAGGGQVSLQAGEGATRFLMPQDNRQTLRLSGSVKAGQASGDDAIK